MMPRGLSKHQSVETPNSENFIYGLKTVADCVHMHIYNLIMSLVLVWINKTWNIRDLVVNITIYMVLIIQTESVFYHICKD